MSWSQRFALSCTPVTTLTTLTTACGLLCDWFLYPVPHVPRGTRNQAPTIS